MNLHSLFYALLEDLSNLEVKMLQNNFNHVNLI